MKKCAVIGSINTDLVLRVPRFPKPGETLTGSTFQVNFGGKGANQAVALAKLGVPVQMAGCVGGDLFGSRYVEHLEAVGADVSAVSTAPEASTGIADILVDEKGENAILLAPGANSLCDAAWLDDALEKTKDCGIFLLQLEIPLETVKTCIARLHAMGKTILLDPAPAAALPEAVLNQVDILTPNETELEALTASLPAGTSPEARMRHLIGDSKRLVIHKRGGDGAYIASRDGIRHIPGFKVDVVDTTAAGDTFNAGLAAGLAMGLPLEEAVRMANAAGALSVTAFGAQGGMPSMEQVQALLSKKL